MFGTHAGGGLVVLTRHLPAFLNVIFMLQRTNSHVKMLEHCCIQILLPCVMQPAISLILLFQQVKDSKSLWWILPYLKDDLHSLHGLKTKWTHFLKKPTAPKKTNKKPTPKPQQTQAKQNQTQLTTNKQKPKQNQKIWGSLENGSSLPSITLSFTQQMGFSDPWSVGCGDGKRSLKKQIILSKERQSAKNGMAKSPDLTTG